MSTIKYADWIKEKVAEIQYKRDELKKELSQNLFRLVEPLFEEYTNVGSLSWEQYTPYYSDGETPEFSCGIDWLTLYNLEGDEFNNDDADIAFTDVLTLITSEIYYDIFGDHAQITIYRDGKVVKTDYEHD